MPGSSAIHAQGLGFNVSGRQILDSIGFEIAPGSFTVVVGENGAGKSTLLRLIMGISLPTSGSLSVLGNDPGRDPHRDRQRVAFIAEKMSPPIDWSVGEYLAFNRRFYPTYSTDEERTLLKEFRLKPESRMGSLSAGEVRRVQVVSSLSYEPDLLVIDEITAVLDIVGRHKFMKALHRLRERKQSSVIMATNILDDVDTYATHVILLHDGKLVRQGTKDEIREGQTLTHSLAGMIECLEVAA